MKKNNVISEKTLWKWFNEFSYMFVFISNTNSVITFHWVDQFDNVRYIAKIDLCSGAFGIYARDEQNCILMYYSNDGCYNEIPSDMLVKLLNRYKKHLENK